jgi:ABC-2 type transport system permease protein
MIAAPSPPALGLALRALLGGRRALALALFNLIPVIAVVVGLAGEASNGPLYGRVVGNLVIPVQIALVALALAGAAVSDEREDGTILYLTQTPLPRMAIVGAKLLAVWLSTVFLTLPGVLAGAVVAADRGVDAMLMTFAAATLAALAYSGLFIWVALRLRRAVITGLVYIVIWEGSIASFADSADRFSVAAYARRLAQDAQPDFAWETAAPTSVGVAVLALLLFAAGGLWVGSRRLERMELP